MDTVHVISGPLPVFAGLAVEIPHAQEAVSHFIRVGHGIHSCPFLVLILFIEIDQLIPEAVFFIDVLLVPGYFLLQHLDTLPELGVLAFQLFAGLSGNGGERGCSGFRREGGQQTGQQYE